MAVRLPSEIPLLHEAEVIVIGGGPGGLGAAISAAREGRDVLLVEHYGFLGGMATAGEVNPFMPNHIRGESLDKGVFTDWTERMDAYGGLGGGRRVFDPNVARLAAEDLCLEVGVRLLFHHRIASVETEDRKIAGLVLHSKSGLTGAKAKIFIDSTGDGDLSAMAGCDFEYGGEGTEFAQPMTLCFKLKISNKAYDDLKEDQISVRTLFGEKSFQLIQEVFAKAKKDGRIECPRENVLMFRSVDKDVVHFNTTRVIHKSSISGQELSEAEIEGRKQLRQIYKVLEAEIPIFKDSRFYSIAPQIGIRESRRIMGRAYVTRDDFVHARAFPDGIARVNYPIDIHSPDGSGTEIILLPKNAWYEVPYGCLVPKDRDNLLIASRCISVDHEVHSSLRVMPPVCSIGQASGTAAAMALEKNILPFEVDGRELKERLIKRGRNLVAYDPNRKWEMSEEEKIRKAEREKKRALRYNA